MSLRLVLVPLMSGSHKYFSSYEEFLAADEALDDNEYEIQVVDADVPEIATTIQKVVSPSNMESIFEAYDDWDDAQWAMAYYGNKVHNWSWDKILERSSDADDLVRNSSLLEYAMDVIDPAELGFGNNPFYFDYEAYGQALINDGYEPEDDGLSFSEIAEEYLDNFGDPDDETYKKFFDYEAYAHNLDIEGYDEFTFNSSAWVTTNPEEI